VLSGSEHVRVVESEDAQVKPDLLRAAASIKPDEQAPGKPCYSDMHKPVFADFVRAMSNGHAARVSIAEAAIANELVLAVYHSTATGREVTLPIRGYRRPQLAGGAASAAC